MKWEHLTFVASRSRPDKQYEIKRREDGKLGCDCPAFKFSGGKECKHTRTVQNALDSPLYRDGPDKMGLAFDKFVKQSAAAQQAWETRRNAGSTPLPAYDRIVGILLQHGIAADKRLKIARAITDALGQPTPAGVDAPRPVAPAPLPRFILIDD